MLLTPDQFAGAFEEIRRSSLTHSTCKLAVCVSCLDVDAICAARILSDLLKKKLIVFQVIPVVGYNDLKKKYDGLDESIANVVLIGCGSMVDLESFLDINVQDHLDKDYYENVMTPENSSQLDGDLKLTRKIYIIDGHRPWNLDNLYGSQMVHCFDDGSALEDLPDEKKAYDYLISIGSDVEEEESEEEEVEDLAGSDSESESRKRTAEGGSQPKRKRTMVQESERKIEDYYNQGTTVVTSSSLQVYTLVSTIGESNIDSLWLSIVGTTSLNANFPEVYEGTAPLLREEVERLREMRTTTTSEGLNVDLGDKADNHMLEPSKEYSLFLLRHWTLYDAFFYSNYVNAKLQLYTTEGKKKLKTMFARMGISLVVASKNWHYVDTSLKKRIDSVFTKNLPQLGLTDVVRDGFVRHYGFQGSMNSGDFAESVTALLEYDGDLQIEKDRSQATTPPAEDEENTTDKLGKLIEKREQQFVTNFWKAYDALSKFDLITRGIAIAQLQQKFIFEKGFEIFQKRLVRNLQVFRLVVLKHGFTSNNAVIDTSMNNFAPSRAATSALNDRDTVDFQTFGSNQKLFQNPLILTKLGNWILEACAEMDRKPLPLVIASLDKDTNTYLVCGLPPKRRNLKGVEETQEKNTVLNTFSLAFQEVANSTGAKARIDSFESSIIEIRKEDLPPFLERLTLSGLV